MKRRAVVEIVSAIREQETKPSVWIDQTKGGEVTFGVKATGRTLKDAREKAVAEFNCLRHDFGKPPMIEKCPSCGWTQPTAAKILDQSLRG